MAALLKILQVLRALLVLVYQLQPEEDNFLYKNIDLICVDEIPEKYKFLKNTNLYKKDFNPKNYDLIIFFDS